jgi:hypothetical protein
MVSEAVPVPRLGSVLRRGLGFGAVWGAVLGVVYLAGLALWTGNLGLIEAFVPAAVVGTPVGAALGLLTALVLATIEPVFAENRRHARWVAGGTCAVAVLVAMWWFAAGFKVVITMVPMAGFIAAGLAPRVLDGR